MIWLLILVPIFWLLSQREEVGLTAGYVARLIGFNRDQLQAPHPNEEQEILNVATDYEIDPRFLAAIRLAENGREGRQFGVLSVAAPTWQQQATVAAGTVKRTLDRYRMDFGLEPMDSTGRLTPDFIRYFAYGGPSYPGYAPLGASNDPTGLNQNWYGNVMNYYASLDVAVA